MFCVEYSLTAILTESDEDCHFHTSRPVAVILRLRGVVAPKGITVPLFNVHERPLKAVRGDGELLAAVQVYRDLVVKHLTSIVIAAKASLNDTLQCFEPSVENIRC